jgi:hypothetical protein
MHVMWIFTVGILGIIWISTLLPTNLAIYQKSTFYMGQKNL